jgi:23S rRNA (adenine2503-C2)-methyltransferase
MSALLDLAAVELGDLEAALDALGAPRFHGRQIYRWIWRRGETDVARMTDLPRRLRDVLASQTRLTTPSVVRRDVSEDGTVKFELRLADGRHIESVYIPDTPAQTFCLSTQVGCAMGCAFCLTGRMGLVRHLTAGEIAGQVRVLARALDMLETPFNIVLMGMGEPLHNYDETMKALRMLGDPRGLGVKLKRITLSTVGLVPMLDRLAHEPQMPNLAISLHATTEELRRRLVPPTRKYSLDELLDACRRFPVGKRDRITFEYVLLSGVNDSAAEARRLASLLAGIRGKVNLIPLNAAAGIPFDRPSDAAVNAFAKILADRGVVVSVRKSRGRDIRAACGQLIVDAEARRPSPAQQLAEAL